MQSYSLASLAVRPGRLQTQTVGHLSTHGPYKASDSYSRIRYLSSGIQYSCYICRFNTIEMLSLNFRRLVFSISTILVVNPVLLLAQAAPGRNLLMADSEINEIASDKGKQYNLDSTSLAQFDKIVTFSREVHVGKVYNITFSDIRYFVPGSEQLSTIAKSQVSQILYGDGRRDVFIALEGREVKQKELLDTTRIIVKNQKDWMKVMVTEDPDQVADLKEYGRLKTTYEAETGNAGNDDLMRQAGIVLKKRAALLKAHYVLVETKFFVKSYGDLPKVVVTAVAYGY